MLFWTLYNSLQDDWLIDPKIHQPYQSLNHLYESSNASCLSNSSHHLNLIGWNIVGLDFVGLQKRKSNHRLIFQFTFWWETHFCFEKIIIIVIVVSGIIIIVTRPKPPYGRQGLAGLWARIQSGGYILGRSQRLTLRLRRSARIG